MIVAYIDEFKVHFGVEQICRVLTEHGITISPSTYYARAASPATDAELADAYTAHEVFCLFHDQRGLYGVLKLWHALRRRGRDIGRDQVARLMGICGITGIVRGKRHTVTTESDPSADRYPDLIDRKWNTPTRPDQWWVADFTYVWTLDGFCYVSFIVDVYVRRVQIGSFLAEGLRIRSGRIRVHRLVSPDVEHRVAHLLAGRSTRRGGRPAHRKPSEVRCVC